MKKGKIGAIALAVIIVIGLICCFKLYTRIPAGYAGVVYDVRSGIANKTLGQGGHIIMPTQEVTLFSIGIEQSYLTAKDEGDSSSNDSFEVPTSDGKGLTVDLVFTYRYDQERLADTFIRFKGRSGKEIKNSFIKPNMMNWTKEVTAKYPVTEILGDKRSSINEELTKYVKQKFDAYGIIIDSASLVDINPDKETRKAIQKKVTAQQELELARIEQNTAKVNAEKEKEVALIQAEQDKETASIKAEQIRIKAQGEADAIIAKAQAQAEANKLIADSMTEELIKSNAVDKWSGNYPYVMSGSSDSMILDVSDIMQPSEE